MSPLAADHSTMERSTPEGVPPDADPIYIRAVAEAWFDDYGRGEREHAVPGTRFRASWAGTCTRALAYNITGQPESNPPSLADVWRMHIGQLVHDALEPAMRSAFPGADVEVAVDLSSIGLDGSCHIDVVVTHEDGTVVSIEYKTVNGFSFKARAQGNKSKGPEGPSLSHIKQAALGALGRNADFMVVGYLALEVTSKGMAEGKGMSEIDRLGAQWTYTRDEYTAIAEREMRRMNYVANLVDDADGDPTAVPMLVESDEGVALTIVDPVAKPDKGRWERYTTNDAGEKYIVDSGLIWYCGYCRHRDTCANDLPPI